MYIYILVTIYHNNACLAITAYNEWLLKTKYAYVCSFNLDKLYYGHPCPWYTVSECSHLCLPSAQGAQKACVCSTGILLKDDKETCNTGKAFKYTYAYVHSNSM